MAMMYPQHITIEYCQYWQHPPELLRVPAVAAASNPEILGVQAVLTYIIRTSASILAVVAALNNNILPVLAV